MANNLISRSLWEYPSSTFLSLWDDLLDETRLSGIPSGLAVSEDDKSFYVDAALPGIEPKDIEVTFERGILSIHGKGQEEEEGKKYYRKATSSFAYTVSAPQGVDAKKEPQVAYKNGMMHVVFAKSTPSKPKRIAVKVA